MSVEAAGGVALTHTQISLNVCVLISVSDVRDVQVICPNSDNITNSHCSPPAERRWWGGGGGGGGFVCFERLLCGRAKCSSKKK